MSGVVILDVAVVGDVVVDDFDMVVVVDGVVDVTFEVNGKGLDKTKSSMTSAVHLHKSSGHSNRSARQILSHHLFIPFKDLPTSALHVRLTTNLSVSIRIAGVLITSSGCSSRHSWVAISPDSFNGQSFSSKYPQWFAVILISMSIV